MSNFFYIVFLLTFAHFHCAIIEDLYESGGHDLRKYLVEQSNIFEDGVSLKIKLQEEDCYGNKLIRMEQFYNGIRVHDSHVVFNDMSAIDENEDTNRFVTGTFVRDLGNDLSKAELGNKKLESRKNIILSEFFEAEECDDKEVDDKISESVIFVDENSKKAQIGFIVGIRCVKNGERSLPTALVNEAGVTKIKFDRIINDRSKAQGPGGNKKIGERHYHSLNVSKSGQSCFLATDEIVVVNNNFSTSWNKTNPWEFQCPNQTTKYIHGGYCPMNDAFNYGNKLVAMFKKFYNLNPLPAVPMVMHVHFDRDVGIAEYDDDWKAVQFGDGDGDIYFPFASGVSIVGHELGHGILHKHIRSCYGGQCGCMDEGFGDITGTTLRRFVRNKPIKVWQAGNEVTTNKPGDGLLPRCLDNPTCTKHGHIDNCADFNHTERHQGAGVLSKAFYSMATKMPRDVFDAYDIIYCSLSKFWYNDITFTKAGALILKAAEKLNETKGKWCLAPRGRPVHYNIRVVVDALREVGIYCGKKRDGIWFCICMG